LKFRHRLWGGGVSAPPRERSGTEADQRSGAWSPTKLASTEGDLGHPPLLYREIIPPKSVKVHALGGEVGKAVEGAGGK